MNRYYEPAIKIDDAAVNGLLGVVDSLAYKVHEIEKHLHNHTDYFGVAGTPSASHKADDLTDGTLASFQLDAGNDTWGAWVQLLGVDDTPNRTGMTYFDFHELLITASEATNKDVFIQVGVGATGAAALTAGEYSTVAYRTPTNQAAEGPIIFQTARHAAGCLVWARTMAIGADTHTINFYFGLHEYPG